MVMGMSQKKTIILFVGPQGSGKTTHAKLLSQLLNKYGNVCVVALNAHSFTHILFTQLMDSVICKLFYSCIKSKFYENLPPITMASPKLYRVLFPFLTLIHMLAYSRARSKLFAYLKRCDIVIDQEGYVFKQLADISWLARYAELYLNDKIWKLFIKFLLRLTTNIAELTKKHNIIVILLHCDYRVLVERYYNRGRVEPYRYINFQYRFYHAVIKMLTRIVTNLRFIVVSTDKPIQQSFRDIIKTLCSIYGLKEYLKSLCLNGFVI